MVDVLRRARASVALSFVLPVSFAVACGSEDGSKASRGQGGSPDSGGSEGMADAGQEPSGGAPDVGGKGGSGGTPMGGTAGSATSGMGGAPEGMAGAPDGMAGMPGGEAGAAGAPSVALQVVPFYESNGAFWNDYVKADGTTRMDATDTACDPLTDGPTYDGCIHGGEMRAAQLVGRSSCDDVTATDSLGAFDWTCVETNADAWIVSTTLKPDKRLADLLDFAAGAWKQITVTASDGDGEIASSEPAVWWTNPVRTSTTGTSTAEVHDIVISRAGSTGQIVLNADKVAFVSEPGTEHAGGLALRGSFTWAEQRTTGAIVNIEGPITGGLGGFHVTRGASVVGGSGDGLRIYSLRASTFQDIVATGAGLSNIRLHAHNGNRFARIATGKGAGAGSARGMSIGNDNNPGSIQNSTFEDLTDDGSGIGIEITRTSGSSFKRLTSLNAAGLVTNADAGIISYATVTDSSFEDLTVTDSNAVGIYIWSTDSTYRRLRVSGSRNDGVALRSANGNARCEGNRIDDVRVADTGRGFGPGNASYGLSLNSHWNVLQNVHVSNTSVGFMISGGVMNVHVANLFVSGGNVLLSHQTDTNGGGLVLQNVTLANAEYDSSVASAPGIALRHIYGSNKYVGNVLTLNSEWGLHVNSALNAPVARYRNLVAIGTTSGAVNMLSTNRATFDGVVRMGRDTGTVCTVAAGATGMTDTCGNEAPSTATMTSGYLASGVIVGPVSADTANTSDTAGQATYATTLDLSQFENAARAWGTTGAGAWPSVDQRGRCVASDTCQIYDFSLLATDTTARAIAPVPTGDDVVVTVDELASATAPTNQADCDTFASPGTKFIAGTPNYCESRFLRDSVELIFDGEGDDDNLCESNETCLYSPNAGGYSPNAGGYQGHGALVSAGAFTDGEITGVTLLRYETNGR